MSYQQTLVSVLSQCVKLAAQARKKARMSMFSPSSDVTCVSASADVSSGIGTVARLGILPSERPSAAAVAAGDGFPAATGDAAERGAKEVGCDALVAAADIAAVGCEAARFDSGNTGAVLVLCIAAADAGTGVIGRGSGKLGV